jgi:diguanylate cyclase (GGDEF)-like protein
MADLGVAGEFCFSSPTAPREETGEPFLFGPALPSKSPEGRLIMIPSIQTVLTLTSSWWQNDDPEVKARRRTDQLQDDSHPRPSAWIGLRFSKPAVADGWPTTPRELAPSKEFSGSWWPWLLALGGALAWHTHLVSSLLDDPITGLPARAELQAILARSMERAISVDRPLTLFLVNAEDFGSVNESFGNRAGDSVMREVADRLRAQVRKSDLVSRFGGAVFAAVLPDTPLQNGVRVAEKLLSAITDGAYLKGALRLRFSVGVCCFEPDGSRDQPLDLIRRADQALNAAKRSGGGRIVPWKESLESEEVDNLDRMTGIFTANLEKDYRNMRLLWDTVSVVAGSTDFEELAAQVVERLFSAFKPERVGLVLWAENDEMRLVHDLESSGTSMKKENGSQLAAERKALIAQARQAGSAVQAKLTENKPDGTEVEISFYGVPLLVGSDSIGCLYLDGPQDTLALDASDLVFLKALAGQLAVALDRARLAEQERRRLQSELKELRRALQLSKLVYRSREMESVLEVIRRVAPTDATVLITGESGTGKELFAQTIHELSPRRKQPMVIVDCSAIATALIDNELFGHEKGAYTGAQQRSIGRLAEANGGSVLLDEVAELPLEVQSKLLRFVQEKQVTPVGGTGQRRVDVRVIAATNRDLAAEVTAGRLREDLYHRLNVVHVRVPALRDRPEDILYLTKHFLKTYSVQYQKPLLRISRGVETALRDHRWPGNVRELQNRLMNAVILSSGEELTADDVGLAPRGREGNGERSPVASLVQTEVLSGGPGSGTGENTDGRNGPGGDDSTFSNLSSGDPGILREAVRRIIEEAVSRNPRHHEPVGKWLDDEIVLETHQLAKSVKSLGATVLGIPETTYRRRLRKAQARVESGLSPTSEAWNRLRRLLAVSLRQESRWGENLLGRMRDIALEEIEMCLPGDQSAGSALMGVSLPTFQRWQEQAHRVHDEISGELQRR